MGETLNAGACPAVPLLEDHKFKTIVDYVIITSLKKKKDKTYHKNNNIGSSGKLMYTRHTGRETRKALGR